jgi:hypothetical protein
MMILKASGLSGTLLDIALALAIGHTPDKIRVNERVVGYGTFNGVWIGDLLGIPSKVNHANWHKCGPYIERERIHLCPIINEDEPAWEAWIDGIPRKETSGIGRTALEAAARCFIIHKISDDIDIPDPLIVAAIKEK